MNARKTVIALSIGLLTAAAPAAYAVSDRWDDGVRGVRTDHSRDYYDGR